MRSNQAENYSMRPTLLMLSFVGVLLIACLGSAEEAFTLREEQMWAALEEAGYTTFTHTTTLLWEERAPWGPKALVLGMALQDNAGGASEIWYWSQSTGLMTPADVAGLGIIPKNFSKRTIQKAPRINPGFPKQALKTRPIPKGLSSKAHLATERILAPVNQATIDIEDADPYSEASKEGLRIAVFQDLGDAIEVTQSEASEGAWLELEDGARLWSLAIRSPQALGQRFHFSAIDLPTTATLIIYNTDNPEESYGPFTDTAPFWTPTCFGESVTLECWLPAESSERSLHLRIDQSTHQYKDIESLAKSSAGACNLDSSCYPGWSSTGLGVGGIGTIGNTGVLWCTGALLGDAEDSMTPWFLTANHCVNSSYKASTIEVYWIYQSDSCEGDIPSVFSIPRTSGGADYLAGNSVSSGTDFAFLRLRLDPPEGLVYLGYDTSEIALDTPVTCIHHPNGDYKRISFGQTMDEGSPQDGGAHLKPLERFHEIEWIEGTTEPGSSGSPLFLENSQMLIGQLWGGYASCYAPLEPDYFGRFDLTFPLIEQWLGTPVNPYDINKSGEVNAVDLQLVINTVLARSIHENADVDQSGAVDAVDIQLVNSAILNGE